MRAMPRQGGGGGTPTHFPPDFFLRHLNLHYYGVGLGYRPPTRSLRVEIPRPKKGGGAAADSAPPPPWIRHCR